MKAAIIEKAGEAPSYAEFPEPVPAPGKSIIRVTASALSHVTRSRASGIHYSSAGGLPFVPGVDGTGIGRAGERVYFFLPEHPYGGMAEFCRVADEHCIALPMGLDATLAAAIAIPGMSSWAALVERAKLRAGATVLINGATGTSGRLAIQIAKHLGAGKVIATGRRITPDLKALGADETLQLTEDREALEESFKSVFQGGVEIVLDYLWGASAEALIIAAAKAAPEGLPIHYVEIGSMSGRDITLPSAALRSSALQLMGSGMGSVPLPRLFEPSKACSMQRPRRDSRRRCSRLLSPTFTRSGRRRPRIPASSSSPEPARQHSSRTRSAGQDSGGEFRCVALIIAPRARTSDWTRPQCR